MFKIKEKLTQHPLSIVMPVFNRAEYIAEAVESVLYQDYALYELIIVDDGSTQPAVQRVVKSYRDNSKIRIFRKKRGGPGSAVNYGARQAQYAYFCRLDSDDKLAPDALAVLNRYINQSPEVSYFYSSRCAVDERSNIIFSQWTTPEEIHKSELFNREKLLKENYCNHLICWKKVDYLEVGGMRKDIIWSEDWDLALRMAGHYSFRNIDEVLYYARETPKGRLTKSVKESVKVDIVRDVQCKERRREILRMSALNGNRKAIWERLEKPKNVLFINNVVELYGAEISMLELCRSLKSFTPIVVLPKKGPLQEILEDQNIKVLIHDFVAEVEIFRRDIEMFRFLKETTEKYDIDVLHMNKAFSFLAEARVITWLKRIPMIVHIRGAVEIGIARKYWLAKADKVLFVSRHSKDHLITNERSDAFNCTPPESIEVVYNGRTLEHFRFASAKRDKIRKRFHIADHEIVAAIVGYIKPLKGQDRFVELAKILLKENRDFKFLIIGDLVSEDHRSYYEGIKETIEKEGLQEKIILTGFLDCKEAFSAIDILVKLSDSEGLPGVIIEAMAAERVVVSNNVGGVPEIIGENGAGYYVQKNNFHKMKKIILKVAENERLRREVGIKARTKVMELFGADRHMKKMEQIYESLLFEKIYDEVLLENKNKTPAKLRQTADSVIPAEEMINVR